MQQHLALRRAITAERVDWSLSAVFHVKRSTPSRSLQAPPTLGSRPGAFGDVLRLKPTPDSQPSIGPAPIVQGSMVKDALGGTRGTRQEFGPSSAVEQPERVNTSSPFNVLKPVSVAVSPQLQAIVTSHSTTLLHEGEPTCSGPVSTQHDRRRSSLADALEVLPVRHTSEREFRPGTPARSYEARTIRCADVASQDPGFPGCPRKYGFSRPYAGLTTVPEPLVSYPLATLLRAATETRHKGQPR